MGGDIHQQALERYEAAAAALKANLGALTASQDYGATGPVREIGTVEDFDGATVHLGVDYGTVTVRSGAQPSRFGPGGRAAFQHLWAEATRAAEAWTDGHPEDREG